MVSAWRCHEEVSQGVEPEPGCSRRAWWGRWAATGRLSGRVENFLAWHPPPPVPNSRFHASFSFTPVQGLEHLSDLLMDLISAASNHHTDDDPNEQDNMDSPK
jgi:hypothetical protein